MYPSALRVCGLPQKVPSYIHNYIDPRNIPTVLLFLYQFLYTKKCNMLMQFCSTFWIVLIIFSWHLSFLYLQIAHQTHYRHHLFRVLKHPLPTAQNISSMFWHIHLKSNITAAFKLKIMVHRKKKKENSFISAKTGFLTTYTHPPTHTPKKERHFQRHTNRFIPFLVIEFSGYNVIPW